MMPLTMLNPGESASIVRVAVSKGIANKIMV